MTKERELLRRALNYLEYNQDIQLLIDIKNCLANPSDDAEEPVAWMYPDDIERFKTNETFAQAYSIKCRSPTQGTTEPLYLHPPKPAEPEAEPEPVAYQWLHSGHFRKQIPKNANAIEWYPLYLHPPRPAEPEAKPIGYVVQYSDGVLGSDIYYTPEEAFDYTEVDGIGIPVYRHPPKPAEPAARKPMTPKERSDGYMELEGILGPDAHLMSFLSGICAAEKHHLIGGDDE